MCGLWNRLSLEEVINDTYLQRKFNYTMADRASIWSWVVIELKGVQSEMVYKSHK